MYSTVVFTNDLITERALNPEPQTKQKQSKGPLQLSDIP